MATQPPPTPQVSGAAGGRERTLPPARTAAAPIQFVRRLARAVYDDNIDDVGAMMAYYTVLAVFPMLVFVVTIALLVIDPETIHQGVLIATRAMPESIRALVAKQVTALIENADAGFAIGGALLALWGASRGASALGGALNQILGTRETRSFVRRQLTAIALTLAVAILIVLALGLLVVGPMLGHYVADRFGLEEVFDTVWGIGRWVGAGVLVMLVWAMLYRFLPDSDAPFRLFTWGAFVGVGLWLGISYLFGIYLASVGSYDTTYGALGSAIAFLTWLWLSNIALLFGAEVNDVLADLRKTCA